MIGKKKFLFAGLGIAGVLAFANHNKTPVTPEAPQKQPETTQSAGTQKAPASVPVQTEPDTYPGFYKTNLPELFVYGKSDAQKDSVLGVILANSCARIIKPTIHDPIVYMRITTNDGVDHGVYIQKDFLEKMNDPSMTLAKCRVTVGEMPKESKNYNVIVDSPLGNILSTDLKNVIVEKDSCVRQRDLEEPVNGQQGVDVFGQSRVVTGTIDVKNLKEDTTTDTNKCYAVTSIDRGPDATTPLFNANASFYAVKANNTPLYKTASKDGDVIVRAMKNSCVTFQPQTSTKDFANVIVYPIRNPPFIGYIAKDAIAPADDTFSIKKCPLVPMP